LEQQCVADDLETTEKGHYQWTPAAHGGADPEDMFHGTVS